MIRSVTTGGVNNFNANIWECLCSSTWFQLQVPSPRLGTLTCLLTGTTNHPPTTHPHPTIDMVLSKPKKLTSHSNSLPHLSLVELYLQSWKLLGAMNWLRNPFLGPFRSPLPPRNRVIFSYRPYPPWLRNIFTKLIQNVDISKKSYLRNVEEGWINCSQMYFNYIYKYRLCQYQG